MKRIQKRAYTRVWMLLGKQIRDQLADCVRVRVSNRMRARVSEQLKTQIEQQLMEEYL